MPEIIRNRTIRPSTRKETSYNYRVDIAKVQAGDRLIVNINHESKPFKKTFYFSGKDLVLKDNISFRVQDFGDNIEIIWSRAKPTNQ